MTKIKKTSLVKMVALCATFLISSAPLRAIGTLLHTASWGIDSPGIWDRNNLYNHIASCYTPGSQDFTYHRLLRPAYYAWMDAYDTRAFASYDSYPPETPSAHLRLLYFDGPTNTTFGTFVTRRDNMRNGNITPYCSVTPRQIAWSSEVVDSCPYYYFEGPPYADFNFTKEPLQRIYSSYETTIYDATQFCFCFNQLCQSEQFPMGTNVRAKNPFQTMLSSNSFGLECYKNDNRIYNMFERTDVNRCTLSHTTFNDIIEYAFSPFENYESITTRSKRLLVTTLESSDQALSLFSRSYKNETPCSHFSKSVYGSAKTGFEAEGTITCDITFDYANNTVTIDSCSASFGSPTVKTNAIEKTDIPYQKAAPCAAYVNITKPDVESSSNVSLSEIAPGETISVAFDDLADALEPIFIAEGASTIVFDMSATYDDFWNNVRISVKKRGTSEYYPSSWRGHFTGSETVSSAPISASAKFSYRYETSTDPNYLYPRQQYPCDGQWIECVKKESWYMFSSFCYSTNTPSFLMKGNLRDHLFSYEKKADDYGFRCIRKTADGPSFHGGLMAYYRNELQELCNKCYYYTGHAFHNDPQSYMDLTAGKISDMFNGEAKFDAKINIKTLDPEEVGGIEITRISPGHYIGGSEAGVIAARSIPLISCTFKKLPQLPPGTYVETYMGIVTEIDWSFPQLIIKN